jgi:ParB family transcriptional regulator, chromosome partitioning protein
MPGSSWKARPPSSCRVCPDRNVVGPGFRLYAIAAFRARGEAKGERVAQLLDHLKKGDMAEKAEALLAGSGWLPEPLRTPSRPIVSTAPEQDQISAPESAGVETAADGYETAVVETESAAEDEPAAVDPHAVAAD